MTHHIENEVYKRLHKTRDGFIDDGRRARAYQANLAECVSLNGKMMIAAFGLAISSFLTGLFVGLALR